MYPNCSYHGCINVPTCCGPLYVKPQRLPRDPLRLRADTCHSEGVQKGLLQWKQAPCHTNCCHVHSFWFHRKLPGAAVWTVTALFFSISSHCLPNSHAFSALCVNVCLYKKTHTLHFFFLSPFIFPFLIYSSRGWVVCTPGQLIRPPLPLVRQLLFLSDQNLFIECSTSGSIILIVLPE